MGLSKGDLALGILTGGVGLAVKAVGKKLLSKKKPAAQQEDPAVALEEEEEAKKKARQRALASLNPTGTTGAGVATTTKKQVLGV